MFSEPQEPTRHPFGTAYLDHLQPHPVNLRQFSGDTKAALTAAARRAACGRWKLARDVPKAARALGDGIPVFYAGMCALEDLAGGTGGG